MTTFADKVTTASTGSNWVTLPNRGCSMLGMVNFTGVDLQWRRVDEPENDVPLVVKSGQPFHCANANEYQVRRLDQVNTPVTLHLILEI